MNAALCEFSFIESDTLLHVFSKINILLTVMKENDALKTIN